MNRNYQSQRSMSHTNEGMTKNTNHRSDGPSPIDIEARDSYTYRPLYNPIPHLSNDSLIQSFTGKGPKGYIRSDHRIEEDVCEILAYDRDIDASTIHVGVENGIVKLSGYVHDRLEKFEIEDIVENVSGVNDVQSEIRVQRSNDIVL